MALAPDGGVIATGQTNRGFLDWYTVALEPTGALRWEAVRDGGLNTDEIPAAVFTLADGTTVVTGKGGPNLPGGFIPGVTVGYGPTARCSGRRSRAWRLCGGRAAEWQRLARLAATTR
jgi:hypothetical protein